VRIGQELQPLIVSDPYDNRQGRKPWLNRARQWRILLGLLLKIHSALRLPEPGFCLVTLEQIVPFQYLDLAAVASPPGSGRLRARCLVMRFFS